MAKNKNRKQDAQQNRRPQAEEQAERNSPESQSPLWWLRISPRRLTMGGVTLVAGMVRITGALVPAFDRSGTWSSIATSRGTSSRLSRRPLTNTTASSTSCVDTSWYVAGKNMH